jgi:hypothetical protein
LTSFVFTIADNKAMGKVGYAFEIDARDRGGWWKVLILWLPGG